LRGTTGNLRTVISLKEATYEFIAAAAAIKERIPYGYRVDNIDVDRSVKVRRDSRKRSQPILANIGHFLLPLERVQYNSE
jgi:hypothetical protein